jgi:ligand-binding SRPBCC domain-containing protein
MRTWEHERTLAPTGDGGCVLQDRVRFEPRLPLPGPMLLPLYRTVFRHRHRRLRRHFGGVLESVR